MDVDDILTLTLEGEDELALQLETGIATVYEVTDDYEKLRNLPRIDGAELKGNRDLALSNTEIQALINGMP